MLTVLLGGARSGKTSLALDIARRDGGTVTYLATMPHIPGDFDLEARIEHHRGERPAQWITVEEEIEVAAALASAETDVIVVDCLTTWVSNLLHHGKGRDEIHHLAAGAAATAARSPAHVVVISNEVGMSIHPTTGIGRQYRDLLGWVNQEWGASADRTLFLIAGRAIPLTDPWVFLS